ncbi:MAG: hypothetical protein K0S26_1640 [Bacteroidota bacterium]|nr:hypothetical protein [Bacteroidota bacterium]
MQYEVEIAPVNRAFIYEDNTIAIGRFAETFKE